MDRDTLNTYDANARDYAADWEDEQSAPGDLHAIVREHFRPGLTIDVGCGSGRDTAWLVGNGYDAFGLDGSQGLIAEARRRHPDIRFERDTLPRLVSLQSGVFTNVLCETVIMHLGTETIADAVGRLGALLAPGGTLYLSWRVTDGADVRDKAGRLYSSFPASLVTGALPGLALLLDEEVTSLSSGKIIHRVVARRR
ncbi:MAG: class I SAM-dependent methyltransferase [Hyphomicrobiaceae bacterium]